MAHACRASGRAYRDDPKQHTVPFVTETLRLSPAVWGIPRTPTKSGVTLTANDATHAGTARPGRHHLSARHQ